MKFSFSEQITLQGYRVFRVVRNLYFQEVTLSVRDRPELSKFNLCSRMVIQILRCFDSTQIHGFQIYGIIPQILPKPCDNNAYDIYNNIPVRMAIHILRCFDRTQIHGFQIYGIIPQILPMPCDINAYDIHNNITWVIQHLILVIFCTICSIKARTHDCGVQ